MLYRVITAMAVLYLEAWYTLGSCPRNVEHEHKGSSFTVIGWEASSPQEMWRQDGIVCLHMETTGLFAWLRGILGDAGEACTACTCTGFRLQPLHREPPLEPLLCLHLLHWSLCCALWWRRKGVQSALFSTFPPLTGEWNALPWVSVVQTGAGNPIFHVFVVHCNAAVSCCKEESKLMIAVIPTMLMICRKMN